MKKPNYIEKIEKDDNIYFSVMDLPYGNTELEKFIDGKFELVHSIAQMEQDLKIRFKEKIYLTKQEFYIYLLITDDDIQVRVFYKQKQLDELRLIIGQLLKQTNLWKLQQKN
jgi:hypothetical protein